jgi:23S rRNA (pseudouridine1915-N3)-methyltransferase
MRLQLVAVGRLKDGPERELCARYAKRIQETGRGLGFPGFDLAELPESRARRPEDRKGEEAASIRARLAGGPGGWLVALDERGASPDSPAFAARLARERDAGCASAAFVIGGADGLDPALRAEASLVLSFGAMTLPHQLVRVLALEQVYRALTILGGHPYHRS